MISLKDTDELIEFVSLNDKMQKLKEWKLLSPKATRLKTFYYKGTYTDVPVECEIIGYLSKKTNKNCIDPVYETVVILINNETHKIVPAYLKQMQSVTFNRYNLTDEDEN